MIEDPVKVLINSDLLQGLGKIPCLFSDPDRLRAAFRMSKGLSLGETPPDLFLDILGENTSKGHRPLLILAVPCSAATGKRIRVSDPLTAKLAVRDTVLVMDSGNAWKVHRLDTHFSKRRRLRHPVVWLKFLGSKAASRRRA